jgi:hypothetical protein
VKRKKNHHYKKGDTAMKLKNKIYALSGSLLIFVNTFFVPVQADELDQVALAMEQWQYNRLFSPSPADRKFEERGDVIIYDGLTDIEVNKALDEHFDRIQNMMFTRTVVTDENGNPKIDPVTGNKVVEDDC